MNICFSHDIFRHQNFGGVSRYVVRLAEAIHACGHDVDISAAIHNNFFLDQSHLGKNKIYLKNPSNVQKKMSRLIDDISSQIHLIQHRTDILHLSYYGRFLPFAPSAKHVITIHDMIDELYNSDTEWGQRASQAKKRSALEADMILCVSENTQHDLINIFNIPRAKTRVTHIAADNPPRPHAATVHPLNGNPYFLYVGNRAGYKNFNALLKAFAAPMFKSANFKIIAFGSSPFQTHEIEEHQKLGLASSRLIHVIGDDDVLYNLYRHAECLVYPSLYEGFGIPPLEAMSVGCPVICSKAGSIPEIVGNAGRLIDPYDHNSIALALEEIVNNKLLRDRLIQAGYQRFQHYSWENVRRKR